MLGFVDTNVFVYLFSNHDLPMQAKAEAFLAGRDHSDTVISPQVLVEFASAMRKYKTLPAEIDTALRTLTGYTVRTHEPDMILRAHTLCAKHQLSWFDALIVQSALDAGCTQLFSEDLSAGQQFSGPKGTLTVVNPLA
jgi:predicted nucleic acid-binding protein